MHIVRGRSSQTLAGAAVVLMLAVVLVTRPGIARAAVFANPASIVVPTTASDGRATPYPSTIAVDAPLAITDVDVTLTGLTHAYPIDLDVLLVGPTGKSVVLMADVGGITPVNNLNLRFDDSAGGSLPTAADPPTTTTSGTYKPTTYGAFSGGLPAPAGPYGATLSVFNGTIPEGVWKLYVFDDYSSDGSGSIAGGWSLDITTVSATTVTAFSPTSGEVGDTVTITGKGFTGATAVKFGTAPVATFTVDSDTQITSTVPAGAGAGRISIVAPNGTGKSDSDFVVNHPRDVSLTLSGKKAKGTIDVGDGFTSCASEVPVRVQRRKSGRWRTIAGDFTDGTGAYSTIGVARSGKYRTVAKSTTLPSGDVCPKAVSPVATKTGHTRSRDR